MKRTLTLVLTLCALASPAQAITRLEIAGGWYGENLPDGTYAVLVPGAIATQAGNIPLPGAELQAGGAGPLYLRITEIGGLAIAGQSHAGLGTWEWRNGQWTLLGPACGVSPVIYDAAGVLHLSDCSIGSQGWRYVADDGHLVTGDETYASPALRLWEYTTHGGISIGQSGVDGCVAVVGGDRRQIEPGDCRFVRFSLAGDVAAVTMVKQLEHKTVLLWFSRGELGAFPPEPTSAPTAPPVPGPAPMPVPVPVPPAPAQQVPDASIARGIVEDASRGIPRPMTAAQVVGTLKTVAARLNASGQPGGPFGVLVKAGGNSCNGYSCDIICAGSGSAQRQWDIFGNADPAESPTPGTQSPGWEGPLSPIAVRDCEVVTTATPIPTPAPPPPPSPAPPPPTVDLGPVLARVAVLEARADALERENSDLQRRLGDVPPSIGEDRIRQLIAETFARAIVDGKTEKDRLGLQHQVHLGITLKAGQ